MRRVIARLEKLFRTPTAQRRPLRPATCLRLEALEDRSLLSGTVSGFAFVNADQTGIFNPSEALPGISVVLTGTASTGKTVNPVTVQTDNNGEFSFANVPSGNFQLSVISPGYLMGQVSLGNVSIPSGVFLAGLTSSSGGQGTQNAGTAGLQAQIIGGEMFLNSARGYPFGAAGGGSNSSIDTPLITAAFATELFGAEGMSNVVDLAGHFSDTGLVNGTMVQFDTSAGTINVKLFDATAPQSVANFLDYVNAGDYDSSIFHRVQNATPDNLTIIQGGAFKLATSPTTLGGIEQFNSVPNEFGASNVAGTLAFALPGNAVSTDINGGTNSFFFNTGDNSAALNAMKFTVFGQVVGSADLQVLNTLMQSTETNINSSFANIPLNGSPGNPASGTFPSPDNNFPGDAVTGNFDFINSVKVVPGTQSEALTYKVLSNSNSGLVTPTLQNEQLVLTYTAGQTGSATITVQASDLFGNTATTTFTVNVIGVTVDSSPNPPTATSTLTANVTGADPSATLSYQWLKNGTAISGQTNSTLDLTTVSGAAAGQTCSVQVTPSIAGVAGNTITSALVTLTGP